MSRVFLSTTLPDLPGLRAARDLGLPERLWIYNGGEEREIFVDFAKMPEGRTLESFHQVDEPAVLIGRLCSWMRSFGLTPPGSPLALGTRTGTVWLIDDFESFVVNWSVPTLEACFRRRHRFEESRGAPLPERLAALGELVRDILEIEPSVASPAAGPRPYWQRHLEGIAERMEDWNHPFPWRTSDAG